VTRRWPLGTVGQICATRAPVTLGVFGSAFGVGCVAGIFVHFLPCVVWSCDWGPGDKEGIRGAIWFSLWPLVTVLLLLFRERGMSVRLTSEDRPVWIPADSKTVVRVRAAWQASAGIPRPLPALLHG
jgi:hypothetical protein